MSNAPPSQLSQKKKDKSFCTEDNLKIYLKNRSFFSSEEQEELKYCIDNYSDCWRVWNKVRWDAAMDTQGFKELKEYLGDEFVPYYDSSWGLAKEWSNKKPKTEKEISEFYKNTENYVYNLVIWHESGDRHKYAKDIESITSKYKIRSAMDFGCGVGTDSLAFINQKISTYSVDFICPATQFFKWRLKKRGIKAKFLNVEKTKKFPKVDMFWAIDVLEHVPDPIGTLEMIDFDSCKVIAHCSRFNDTAGGRHPCHINFESKLVSELLISKGFKNIEGNKDLSVWINLNLVNIDT